MKKPGRTKLNPLVWRDARDVGVVGQGWPSESEPFTRLPDRARGVVGDNVWKMSRWPAGLAVVFATDAPEVHVRWLLARPRQLPNAADTGMMTAAIDGYGRHSDGTWYWIGCTPPPPDGRVFESKVNKTALDGEYRAYLLHLPVGTGVAKLEVGVDSGARFEAATPDTRPPVVYYGTSIVHGYCVSRPGVSHVNLLRRRLDYPFVNLGFGGCGRMDCEVAELMAELDAALYVVDCLPNMSTDLLPENFPRLVEAVRAKRPDTPILFVGDRLFGDAAFQPDRRIMQEKKNRAQREAVERLQRERVAELHLFEPANPFGDDFEGTIDGSHPTDVGAMRMAEALEPVLNRFLPSAGGGSA